MTILIYGSSISPYVRKVLVFAAESGIDIDNTPTIPRSTDAEFRAASPFGKIPGLKDGDFLLSDSTAIVFYLEAIAPGLGLLPPVAKARAKTIWWDEFADTILFDTVMKTFVNRVLAPTFQTSQGDIDVAKRSELEELPPLVDYLETSLASGAFLVGEHMTLADMAVASPWVNMIHAGVRPNPSTHPNLAKYLQRMFERPSFARVIEKEREFLARHGVNGSW